MQPNWLNRTMWTAYNLDIIDIMRGMNNDKQKYSTKYTPFIVIHKIVNLITVATLKIKSKEGSMPLLRYFIGHSKGEMKNFIQE